MRLLFRSALTRLNLLHMGFLFSVRGLVRTRNIGSVPRKASPRRIEITDLVSRPRFVFEKGHLRSFSPLFISELGVFLS